MTVAERPLTAAEVLDNRWRLTPDRLAHHLDPAYLRPRHIRLLGAAIAEAVAKDDGRLIINTPPQIGKSLLASRSTPVWTAHITAGQARIGITSYGAEFASEWGEACRDIIAPNQDLLGVHFKHAGSGLPAAKNMLFREGGRIWTAGAGGPITGRSADVLIIDDPHKNFEDAHSPLRRRRLWNWWISTARTRVQPGGTVICIMTRWHEEDLTGKFMLDSGDEWTVITIPALCEDPDVDPLGRQEGESINPERYTADYYRQTEREVGPYVFAGMYQQRPAPLEGGMFKRADWRYADAAPAGLNLIRRWDLAATAGGGDATVGLLLGRHEDGRVFILDMVKDRLDPHGVEELVRQTAADDRRRYGRRVLTKIEQEPGASGKIVAQTFIATVLPGYRAAFAPSSGDKTVRAFGLAAQVAAHNVWLVKRQTPQGPVVPEWWDELVEEAALFPIEGKHDDAVDVASQAFNDAVGRGDRRVKTGSAARQSIGPAAR